jgi:hypothetical protein
MAMAFLQTSEWVSDETNRADCSKWIAGRKDGGGDAAGEQE